MRRASLGRLWRHVPGAAAATLVAAACGSEPNQAPAVPVIESPRQGETYGVGTPVQFLGGADDPEDGSLGGGRLAWASSLDGTLGSGGSFARDDLSEGAHAITLVGTDSEGQASSTSVDITVEDYDPGKPVITSPIYGQEFGLAETIVFEGSASDPEDGELTGESLVWRSTVDGTIGTGTSFSRSELSEGEHRISLTATDSNGQSAERTSRIRVVNRPPESVTILSPDDGVTFASGAEVELRGSAEDPEDGPLAGDALTWISHRDGTLGSGSPVITDALSDGVHVLTLLATDSRGLEASSGVEVAVGPVFVETSVLGDAREGLEYEAALSARGGTPPFTWSVAEEALPGGLALDPSTGILSGLPTAEGTATFTVRVTDDEGGVATADLALRICGPMLDLAVGEIAVTDLPFGCGRVLARADADYRVALMARDVSRGPDAVAGGLLLRAVAGTPGEVFPAPARSVPRTVGPRPVEEGLDPEIEALARATERLHMRLREEELARVPNAPGGGRPSVLGPPMEEAGPAAPERTVATERTFWVRDYEADRRIEVDATLRGSNGSLLYYEDDGVVQEGSRATDTEIQKILDYYEAHGRPLIDEVFGGLGPEGTTGNFRDGEGGAPLVLPTDDLDRNEGRLIVLQIRPSLMRDGAAAYVSSCDRVPRPENYNAGPYTCTGSNQAEITYIRRPESDFYLGSVVHEAKHVSSHGYAIFAGRGFNPSWIEEGTAEIAKEKSSRDAAGLADGTEAGLSDLYPASRLTPETYGMGVVHSRARRYLKAAPRSAIVGNPVPNPASSTYYGASWLFHRYLADTYGAGDEDAFFRALNTGGAGVARIEDVTGRSVSELFTELLVAVAVEGEADARSAVSARFRSYDFAAVAAPFDGSWPYVFGSGGDGFDTGDWEISTIHFTSAGFIDLSGGGATWLRLDLLRPDGQDLPRPDDVGMVLVRVR